MPRLPSSCQNPTCHSQCSKTLKDLFDRVTEPPPAERQSEHEIQLGAAVLLVEVMRTDASFDPAERDAVIGSLRDIFSLSSDESDRLFELAHRTAAAVHRLLHVHLAHQRCVQRRAEGVDDRIDVARGLSRTGA